MVSHILDIFNINNIIKLIYIYINILILKEISLYSIFFFFFFIKKNIYILTITILIIIIIKVSSLYCFNNSNEDNIDNYKIYIKKQDYDNYIKPLIHHNKITMTIYFNIYRINSKLGTNTYLI